MTEQFHPDGSPISDETKALHAQQVAAGKIPADAPPWFTAPEDGLGPNGLPWWFGPDYHPTEEALASFAEPVFATDNPNDPDADMLLFPDD